MPTATDQHLGEVRRRIDRLEVLAHRGTDDAKSRLQQYIDALRRDEESARTSARQRAAAADASLEDLDIELELAELHAAAEFAESHAEFKAATEAELDRWDAYLDRMQAKAAAKRGADRERAEAAVADLRQRRVAAGQKLSDAGTAAGEDWHAAKARALADLDHLKSKADEARHD